MSAQIKRRFDRAGTTYEASALVQRQVAARLASLCPETLSGPVLEIGAGSGLMTRLLTERHSGGPYVALDISSGMLAHASMAGAVKVAADGERPPFPEGTFAFLASASAMHWYAAPERSIAADLRLLRPGGGFALALYVEGTLAELGQASRATGFGSIYPMRPAAFYRELLAGVPGIVCGFQEMRHVVRHDSVTALLKSLQGAGVTHTPDKRAASPERYRAFSRYYADHFGDADGVMASYAVIYTFGERR